MERFENLLDFINELNENGRIQYDDVDDDYAWEKLRRKAQDVTGIDIRDIYEVYAKTEEEKA